MRIPKPFVPTIALLTLAAASPNPVCAQEPTPAPGADEGGDILRPTFRIGDLLRVELESKLQGDLRESYDGAELAAGLTPFDWHMYRLGVRGRALKHFDFEIERELTENELTADDLAQGYTQQTAWKDVTVNVDYSNHAQVRAGRFKIPFGLDQLTGPTHNDFIYRSLGADYLAPARDIGAVVHGRLFARAVRYWAGGFQHDGDNARSKKIQGGDGTFAFRVTANPLAPVDSRAGHLQLGTAFTVSSLSADSFRPNGLRGRTAMTEETFFDPVYVNGHRQRWEGDLDWTIAGGGVRAEYTRVTDERIDQGYAGETLPLARYQAWYVSGTYLLTGEPKRRPVVPRRDLLRGGIGAIEIAARIEQIWYDSVGGQDGAFRNPRAETILPSGDHVLTLGVNWMPNRWVKLQIDAIRQRVDDPERAPLVGTAPFWSRVLRFQFVL